MIATIPTLRTLPDSKVAELFSEKSPILVEVRFPHMGTAPDWYLCHVQDELTSLTERLGAGVELHLHSVWDLGNTGSPVIIESA